jgi:hypothetical protein
MLCRAGWSAAILVVLGQPLALAGDAPTYFPLRLGNWWAYEEQGQDGATLSRETWTVVEVANERGEFHLRSVAKRLDGLGRRQRWESHEYLRDAADGLHKRYPSSRDADVEMVLLKATDASGARWRDAQGECEVKSRAVACVGPRGELPDCMIVVCRQGSPIATIVTSVYGRDVGMVRQEVELVQFMPNFESGAAMLPEEGGKSARSVLRLTSYSVRR